MELWQNKTMDYYVHIRQDSNLSYWDAAGDNGTAFEHVDYYFYSDAADLFAGSADDIWHRVNIILTPMLVCFGIIGNVSCGLILSLSSLRFQSVSVFLTACLFSDSFFLTGMLCMWMSTIGVEIGSPVQWCQFLSMLTNPANFLSTWFGIALLVDQCFTWTLSITCSPGHAKVCVLSITSVAVVVYVNLTLIMDAQLFGKSIVCLPLMDMVDTFQVLYKLDLLINIVIPFCACLCITSVCVGYGVKMYRARPSPVPPAAGVDKHTARCILTMMLLLQLLPLPYNILRAIHTGRELLGWQYYVTDSDHLMQNVMQYVYNVFFTLKGYLLLLFWRDYRRRTCKILRRAFCYSVRRVNCKRLWPVVSDRGVLAMWHKAPNVTFASLPSADRLHDVSIV